MSLLYQKKQILFKLFFKKRKLLRMTQQQYSRFENGVFELNYEQILYLCNLYDITPSELFDIDNSN